MEKIKKAFTLAEVMIVLTVIGILTAILMPAAFHSMPNENVMKFKKANSNLGSMISELASNEKYYKLGDLRFNAAGNAPGNNYMCQAIADFVTAKSINCSNNNTTSVVYIAPITSSTSVSTDCTKAAPCNLTNGKAKLDDICDNVASPTGVITNDDIIWYEANQAGLSTSDADAPDIDPTCTTAPDCNKVYKVFCLKIDTLYFGYGIRSDGKIITGANADTYMNRSLQDD